MLLSEFDYHLPESAIAQAPVDPRDASRLLVLHRADGRLEHRVFRDIIEYVSPDDTLVVNDTRVIPARVWAVKETGGRVEVLLLARRAPGVWEAAVRPGRRVPPGTWLMVGNEGLRLEVLERTPTGGRVLRAVGASDPDAALLAAGEIPLPPYIHGRLEDSERYQTLYARHAGSAAAPTAGLHFTEGLLKQITARGTRLARVTLHIGLDTFRPVREEEIERHQMHAEEYTVAPEAAEVINATRGRVIAVGTTTTRVLESVADEEGRVRPGSGVTRLYIRPGYRFRVVDAMVTNFHLPRSTLLIMVSAFAGRELVLRAYREAQASGYRFLSFGDAMLIV
jgi:S-adenosylmethionine:tRNA ribosyltransferase-isomerase